MALFQNVKIVSRSVHWITWPVWRMLLSSLYNFLLSSNFSSVISYLCAPWQSAQIICFQVFFLIYVGAFANLQHGSGETGRSHYFFMFFIIHEHQIKGQLQQAGLDLTSHNIIYLALACISNTFQMVILSLRKCHRWSSWSRCNLTFMVLGVQCSMPPKHK